MNSVKCDKNGFAGISVRVKKLKENAVLPVRGSEYAAGYDLCACLEENVILPPHSTLKVGTGLAFELPEGCFGAVFARSGMAAKQGLRPANCVGVCDSDYRGEYIVAMHNDSDTAQEIKNGERIAQLVILPFIPASFIPSEELSQTQRGEGGFGSTGK